MADFTFDVDQFRIDFPAFEADPPYTDSLLQRMWDLGTCYVSPKDYGILKGACRLNACNLITAHLTALNDMIQAGEAFTLPTNAAVGSINVGLVPPPQRSMFEWWLCLTPYGTELFAMLEVRIAGGMYIGGRPENSAFRKVGGVF